MSRVERMIAELCPGGVEFKSIGDLADAPSTVRWAERRGEEFEYVDLSSVNRVTHAIAETTTITAENAPSRAQQLLRDGDVIFGTTRPMLKRYARITERLDGQICSTGFCVLRPRVSLIHPGYLFHSLGTDAFYRFIEANQRGASYPAIADALVKSYRIAVPPMAIQLEIAQILDKMEMLKAELEAELEAEIEYRARQYAYYRDALLTFEDLSLSLSLSLSLCDPMGHDE